MTLVHVLMLVLFVGWGAYFVVRARSVPARPPAAREPGRRARDGSRSATEIGVVVAEAVLLVGFALPLWFERTSARPTDATPSSCASSPSSSSGTCTIRAPTANSARRHRRLISPTNPLGLDRAVAVRQGRRRRAQPAASAGQPAGRHPAHEQGRHPQLRRAGDAREAGRDSRPVTPVWFTPTVDRASSRSRARSSAVSPITGCAASSQSIRGGVQEFLAEEARCCA